MSLPPSSAQCAAVRSSHSCSPAPSSSVLQHRVTLGGGVETQGLGSQEPAPRSAPPSSLHSAAVVSSHCAPSLSGRQQRVSAPSSLQGSGKHEGAPGTVPPSSWHTPGGSSVPSSPPSSLFAMQQQGEAESSGISPSSSSSPWSSLTT